MSLAGGNAHSHHFGRQLVGGFGHAVLHVDGRHVGVGALTEKDRYLRVTIIGSFGNHVVHVFHPVDGVFQGGNHAVENGARVGPGIAGGNADGGWGDVGILLHGQRHQADNPQDDNENGNDGG